MELYRKYMILIGVFGQLLFYSEFITIVYYKSAHDVSLFGFFCGLVSVTSWLIYGILIKDKPLIIANTFATIGAFLTVSAILVYR